MERFNGYLAGYADDLKTLCQYGKKMQEHINKVVEWLSKFNLTLIKNKCWVLVFGKKF